MRKACCSVSRLNTVVDEKAMERRILTKKKEGLDGGHSIQTSRIRMGQSAFHIPILMGELRLAHRYQGRLLLDFPLRDVLDTRLNGFIVAELLLLAPSVQSSA